MNKAMPFGEILEAADQLSPDEQQELVAILNRRVAHASRRRIADEIQEARRDFAAGRCVEATPEEILREIMK